MEVVRFDPYDSTAGSNHSYSGSHTGYHLFNPATGKVYKRRVGHGAFQTDYCVEDPHHAAPSSGEGEVIDVALLGEVVQRELGFLIPVPDGLILVRQHYGEKSHDLTWYEVKKAGDMIPPRALEAWTVIRPGEETCVRVSNHPKPGYDVILKNDGGNLVTVDTRIGERKSFARELFAELRERGYSSAEAKGLVSTSGPGAVRPALDWVRELLKQHGHAGVEILTTVLSGGDRSQVQNVCLLLGVEWGSLSHDTKDHLFCGVGGRTGYGQDREIAALSQLKLGAPSSYNSRSLFAALDAAREVLRLGYRDLAK